MRYRLTKFAGLYVVEYLSKGLFRDTWKPITTFLGSDKPYYYQTPENAVNAALHKIKRDIELHP